MNRLSTTSGNALERRQALRSFLGVSPALVSIGLFLIVPMIMRLRGGGEVLRQVAGDSD